MKKVILPSIATILLCLCLIVGSTFALFTSTSKIDITVLSGSVDMTASVDDFTIWSAEATAAKGDDTDVIDENNHRYGFVDKTQLGYFVNGGTANITNSILTIDRIAPGDKVTFTILGENASNITIQYRYRIEVISGDELMKGLIVKINDTKYVGFKSMTSVWQKLEVGKTMENVPVEIELPITAGNDYKNLTSKIAITVEAIQGSAVVENASLAPTVSLVEGEHDLQGEVIPNSLVNNGTMEIKNGEIKADAVGVDNFGDITLKEVDVNAGSAIDYGFRAYAGSTTVLTDTNVKSGGGAIAAVDGANLTFNSGSVEVDSKSTSGRYLFYAVGEGTIVTIKDGEFDFNKTQNQKRAYVYCGEGATVYIEGGNFGKASTRSGYTAGILGDGDVVISGGTFKFDPTNWLKDGYTATKVGDTYYVTVDGFSPATNSDTLVGALEEGKDVVMTDDVKIDPANMSNAYGTTGINVKNGQTIDGNGHILDIQGAGGTWDSGISTTGGTIKNITITGSFRGIFINHNSTHSEKVVLENVIIDGTTYTISCDQGANQGLEATNCTFKGWTSYAKTLGEAKFVDCYFGYGNGYAYCRPYAPTAFVDCEFEEGYTLDPRAKVTFENCTIGGVKLTADNLSTLVTNVQNAEVIG